MLVWSCASSGGGGTSNQNDNVSDNSNDNGSDGTPAGSSSLQRDLWVTESTGESGQDFSAAPIPEGFFDFNGRQCGTFDGSASFGGAPISEETLGAADTFVDRSGDPIGLSDPVGTTGSVDIEIVALNMRSLEPVTVLCDGEPTEWNVRVDLSETPAPMGSLTATKNFSNGGTAESVLFVMPRLVFTNVDDPTVERVLDVGLEGGEVVEFHATIPWVHALDPANPDPEMSFILGVDGSPAALKQILQANGEGGGTLIPCVEHFNPSGSHLHNTCAADTDGDGITDGVDNCRFEANPGQEDEDGDTFGDACDPCPTDPECPATGQCDEICPELNSRTCELIEPVYEVLCEFLDECLCLPPDCDPLSSDGPSESCLTNPFSEESFTELTDVSEQFVALGCDRCVLDPCPPPPCEFPQFGSCDFINCPDGKTCNSDTQECCDPITGECCDFMAGECTDLCEFITCPEGKTCDSVTQKCCDGVTGECCDLMAGECFNICDFVSCEGGLICNPDTGVCE
jgi:hypothetical protein